MRLTIVTEPRGPMYRRLLEVALRYCNEGLVVTRESLGVGPTARAMLAALAPHMRAVEQRSEWPGTVLYGEHATIHRFRYDLQTADLLLAQSTGLYDWRQPDLPEDLCLLSQDTPWLVTVAHERDAYLDVPASDLQGVMRSLEDIHLIADNAAADA